MRALLLGRISEEGANAGKLACRGRRPQSLGAPMGEEGAQVRRAKPEQSRRADLLASIPPKEIDQPVRGRHIGPYRMRRAAAVVLQIG
jgi:hypothetical protein